MSGERGELGDDLRVGLEPSKSVVTSELSGPTLSQQWASTRPTDLTVADGPGVLNY